MMAHICSIFGDKHHQLHIAYNEAGGVVFVEPLVSLPLLVSNLTFLLIICRAIFQGLIVCLIVHVADYEDPHGELL